MTRPVGHCAPFIVGEQPSRQPAAAMRRHSTRVSKVCTAPARLRCGHQPPTPISLALACVRCDNARAARAAHTRTASPQGAHTPSLPACYVVDATSRAAAHACPHPFFLLLLLHHHHHLPSSCLLLVFFCFSVVSLRGAREGGVPCRGSRRRRPSRSPGDPPSWPWLHRFSACLEENGPH